MGEGLPAKGNSVFKAGEAEKDMFFFTILTLVRGAESEGEEMPIAGNKIDRLG